MDLLRVHLDTVTHFIVVKPAEWRIEPKEVQLPGYEITWLFRIAFALSGSLTSVSCAPNF